MKKLFVFGLAVFLVVAFTVPVSAKLENILGGYTRTRFWKLDSVNALDDGANDSSFVDTRTRLYYTAKINDNIKFKFESEMDAYWGKNTNDASYGGPSADAKGVFEIRHTYLDLKLWGLEWQMGTQNFTDPSKALVWSDEYTGIKSTYRAENMILGLYWIRAYEGSNTKYTAGSHDNGKDYDILSFIANFKPGNLQIVPWLTWYHTNSGGSTLTAAGTATEPQNIYFPAITFNAKLKPIDLAFHAVYETGSISDTDAVSTAGKGQDVNAFALDGKIGVNLGPVGVWFRGLYLSGDDDATDNDQEGWTIPHKTQSVKTSGFWGDRFSMGFKPDKSPGTDLTNAMHFNLGAKFKPAKTWTIQFDYWFLSHAEDVATVADKAKMDNDIGSEFDLLITYDILKPLKLELMAEYFLIGDAYEPATDSADPIKLCAQFSIKF